MMQAGTTAILPSTRCTSALARPKPSANGDGGVARGEAILRIKKKLEIAPLFQVRIPRRISGHIYAATSRREAPNTRRLGFGMTKRQSLRRTGATGAARIPAVHPSSHLEYDGGGGGAGGGGGGGIFLYDEPSRHSVCHTGPGLALYSQ